MMDAPVPTWVTNCADEIARLAQDIMDIEDRYFQIREKVLVAMQYARKQGRWSPSIQVHLPSMPIDMVLYCPACGRQHIDTPELGRLVGKEGAIPHVEVTWTNPPHRTHLCQTCGFQWRPADVPTNGVQATKTKGSEDRAKKIQQGPDLNQIIYALDRARDELQRRADRLRVAHDYSSEFPYEDAQRIREAIMILKRLAP